LVSHRLPADGAPFRNGDGVDGVQGVSLAADALIAEDAYLGNHVTVYPKVQIGAGCTIMDGAVLGRPPIANGTTTRPTQTGYIPLVIGAGTTIGCGVVVYTGCQIGSDVLVGDMAALRECARIGDHAIVGRGVTVSYECQIGARSRVQDQAHLVGNMVIEEDVFIGMSVVAVNDNDVYLSRFGLSPLSIKAPVVRRYAVIGAGAILLPGIEIGEGAMVAAGSVVTHDVAAWTVVMGTPARTVRAIPPEWRALLEERAAH
jgi:acetyltransferase-like isoleucine patch superfamily enzyme